MSTDLNAVFDAALRLPAGARAVLAEKLLDSLTEQEEADVEAAWLVEVEKRLAAYHRGEMKAIPVEEVLRSLSIRKMFCRNS